MINKINGISPQQFSQQHCNKGAFDCSWYHGNWHRLKALGVVSTSAVHEQSILKLLKLAMNGMTEPRILLTGSTDETLVRIAHHFCQAAGIKEKLFALDICATPLAFMQNYADDNDIELSTYQSDILSFDSEQKFDIILTHAFMGYFDDSQRPLLVKKWQQLLSKNGKIVTIQRVRPKDSAPLVTFTDEQSAQFVSAAVAAVETESPDNIKEHNKVKLAAGKFAKNFVSHAITSKNDLESLFTNSNMSFRFLEYHMLEKRGELSGPSVPSNAEFAHIIAENSRS